MSTRRPESPPRPLVTPVEGQAEIEERYRLLAENSTDMISRHDPAGVYLYVSPACQRLLGYQPHELDRPLGL